MDNRLKEITYSVEKLDRAVLRLQEAVAAKESDLKIDATIQRFEFTFELAWKTLKRALLLEGEICKTPRECLKAAFRLGLLDDEEQWLSMLDDRNAMAHIYDETAAKEIFSRIPGYYLAFAKLVEVLRRRYSLNWTDGN
jgi:nucleotidyltransferase substrate binding protein (TIGR01987 family)